MSDPGAARSVPDQYFLSANACPVKMAQTLRKGFLLSAARKAGIKAQAASGGGLSLLLIGLNYWQAAA
ncbi:hypothetical protein PC41400_26810 [Paenibacillus chitinolyticus]|uniref:Uncharacterized protein n=1 Tax=Paenibacillus chitinolyticus TaxID=79263 RepID=A0A410X393_9BACL|nr:hypothetical protein PC41400_26810 [Paenibacillus chitinolyticus]